MATRHTAPPEPPDEAPDQREEPDQREDPPPEGDPPMEWQEGFRSMLDHPDHPLHHLKDA